MDFRSYNQHGLQANSSKWRCRWCKAWPGNAGPCAVVGRLVSSRLLASMKQSASFTMIIMIIYIYIYFFFKKGLSIFIDSFVVFDGFNHCRCRISLKCCDVCLRRLCSWNWLQRSFLPVGSMMVDLSKMTWDMDMHCLRLSTHDIGMIYWVMHRSPPFFGTSSWPETSCSDQGRLDPVREQFKKWDKDGKGTPPPQLVTTAVLRSALHFFKNGLLGLLC